MEPWEAAATNAAINEATHYLFAFAIAAAAGLSRAVRDRDYQSGWNLVGLCACSGFISFGLVAFLCEYHGPIVDSPFYYFGMAALIGGMGKEADRLQRWAVESVFQKLGIPKPKPKNQVCEKR